jgi:hypothetical protein
MTFNSRKPTPLPTQRDVAIWALVWVAYPLSMTPSHPPPHLNEFLFSPQQLPHLTSRHLGNLPLISSACFVSSYLLPPWDLGSLFDAPLAAPAHGSEDWSEPRLYNMMSREYWALNSGDPKGTIISSKHGCNSWLIMGNWLSSLNQTKVMAHIIAGEAQLVGILIPK